MYIYIYIYRKYKYIYIYIYITFCYRLVNLTVFAFGAGGSVADGAAFASIGLVDSKVRLGACVGSFQAHVFK